MPRGAVDTHAHVIGLPPKYPFMPGRSYTPPEATAKSYLAMLDATGMAYGVLTQVSVHGTDIGFEKVEQYASLCKEMGWHLQFLVDARELPALASRLSKLPVPFLVDHMGHFPTSEGVDNEGFKTLVSLVKDGAWVRLSGAYRNTDEGPPYRSTIPFAHKLVEASPGRCVWGADWPHVANWGVMMGVSDLLDLLADWVPDEKLRDRILVDNPQRLFGFPKV